MLIAHRKAPEFGAIRSHPPSGLSKFLTERSSEELPEILQVAIKSMQRLCAKVAGPFSLF
jgi:hypothetical protein